MHSQQLALQDELVASQNLDLSYFKNLTALAKIICAK